MNNLYNKTYLKHTLILLGDEIKDLSRWSAENGDKYIEEVIKMRGLLLSILKGEK